MMSFERNEVISASGRMCNAADKTAVFDEARANELRVVSLENAEAEPQIEAVACNICGQSRNRSLHRRLEC